MTRYEQLQAEQAEKRKKLNARKIGVDNLATLKDEREDVPTSIRARIDADIAKGREAEAVKQKLIAKEREDQDSAIAESATPKISDINRSAAPVDYSPEAATARERYVRDNPTAGMSTLAKLEYTAQKYNPLALSDMAINTAQMGVQNALLGGKRFAAEVGDYTKLNRVDNPFLNYIEKAKETLRQIVTQKPPVVSSTANDPVNWQRDPREEYYNTGKSYQSRIDTEQQALYEKFKDVTENDVGKAIQDLSGSIGYMIPAQIANAIIPKTGSALLYAAGYASGEKQALSEGASAADAKNYGILNGLNQSIGEELVGGAVGATSGITNAMLKAVGVNLINSITNPALKLLAKGFRNVFGEAIEEGIQNVADVGFQQATYKPDAKIEPKGVAYDMLLGGLMGGVYGAPGMVSDAKALKLPSVQTETNPVRVSFAERNAADLSRINADLSANLRTADGEEQLTRLKQAKTDTERTGILAGASEQNIQVATRFATKGNLDIEFYREDVANGTIKDGFTQGGKIYINAASNKASSLIISHELLHNLEQTKGYDAFKKYVSAKVDLKANVAQLTDMYQRAGIELNPAEVESEAMAKYAETIFDSEEEIYNLVRTDRTLGERIHAWVSGMVKKLTGTDEEKYLLKAKELYGKALAEARRGEVVSGDRVMASVSKVDKARDAISDETKNKLKILDPVTYDDSGNVIPLSQRFNPDNPDIRYSVSKDGTAAKSNTRKVTNASPDAIAAKEARRAIKELESQNAKLREVNEYQRKQFKRSERKEANPKAVAKYVKRLLRSYTSKTSFDNIAKKLADLYIYIANGDESGSPGWETAYEQARDIANDIIEGSEVLINGDALETFSKIKNYFKGKKFYVPADKKADFGDYQEFRRKNFGHFTLTTDPASGAKGVDIYYGELTELFGEGYFPSEITNPADQLQHISHVMDGMNAIYGNPFSGQAFDEVTAIVASDMLDKFYDIPQADPTFADKAAKELTLAKVKGQAKLDALRERKDAQIEKVRQDLRESAAKKLADLRQKNDDKIAKLKADIRERAAKARKTIRQLEAANSKLRELNEYQRAQFEVTTEIKPDAKAVTQYIRSLRKRYASKIPAKTVTDKMAGLFAYNEAEDRVFDWDQAYGIATDLARSIIDSASVPVTVHDETIAFLAHEILDKSYVLPDAPPTFADRAAAALSKERERSEARISDIRAESKRKLDEQKHLVKQAEVQSAWEQGAESRAYAVQTYVKQLIAEYKSHAAPLEIVSRIKKILSFPENGDRAELLSLARDVAEKVLSSREPDAGTIADNAADKIAEEIADRFRSASRISRQQVVRIIKEMEKSDRLTQYIGRGRESRSKTSLRNRIRKGCQRMVKMLAKPDKNRHIPDELQQNVAELFDMIAKSPDEIIQTGDMAGTPKIDSLKNRIGKVSDLYRRMLAENNAPVTLDPDMQAMFDQAAQALETTPFGKLDAEQLDNLYKLTRAIYKSITTANKAFRDAQNRTYDDLAEAVRADNSGRQDRKPIPGKSAKKVVDDLVNFSVIDPRRLFKRLGKTMETLYLNIEHGQDKYIETVTKTVEFMKKTLDGIDTTKWDGDGADRIKVGIITDEFAGTTQEVEFTPAMLMDLYLANKREQSRKHLYGIGGIALQPPGTDKPTKPLKINEQQINDILNKHMTPEMTRVANAMSEYLAKEMGALANEVSQEMYEYSKFTETNYWPIDVHRGSVAKSFGEVKGDPTLENSGATKTLVEKANNALVIKSALDVFDKHSIWAAAYNAYVPALADMRHVLNVKDADGTTIASLLNDKFGERTEKYINNFMNLVNSGKLSHGLWNDKISKKLLRNFKAASVGMNLSVVIKQPVSYIRAADVINPKYLIKALKLESRKTRRANMAEMLKYNPIARIKDWGFADMGFGKNQRQLYDKSAMTLSDKISEASGFLPSQADKVTWARIWAAVKLEQQAKGVMDVARWAERFREVISSTQVVNTIFTTPPILNEGSTLTSMATVFMAEPLESFNMLHDAVSSQNAARIRRTAATLITNTFAIAIIDTAFKHLRQKKDEEDTTLLSLSGEVLLNMVEDVFSMLPYARDIISILQGYNVDRADLTGIDKLWKALSSTGNDIAATVTGGEPRGTVLSHLKDVVAGVSVVTGIPAGNIWRDVESVLRSFAQNTNNAGMEYLITATLYNPENGSNGRYYYDMLYKYRNDDKVYEALKNRLIGEHGYQAENIEDAILSRWKKSGEYKSAYESEAARVMPSVEGNPHILELPKAERESLTKQADTYAAAVARDRLDGDYELNASAKKIKDAVEDGLSVGEYLLYTNARKKADEALDDNGSYGVKEKVRAIRDLSWLNVSKQQALLILDTRTKDNPEGLANEIEAILGSGLSFDEFLNVYERHNEIYNEEDLSASAKALKYANWLDGRYTAEQSDTIQEYFDYWSGAKAVPTNYNQFTDAGMDIDTAYDLADSISKLEPMEGQKAVSTLQRYRVIADAEISDKDKLRAMSVLMSETGYKALAKARLKGLKIDSYVKYLEGTADIVSDVKNGETIFGSRKQKVLTYINRMLIPKAQKDLLYDIEGYSAGTIDDAPWHGGERYDGDIHQRKVNGRQLRPLS